MKNVLKWTGNLYLKNIQGIMFLPISIWNPFELKKSRD